MKTTKQLNELELIRTYLGHSSDYEHIIQETAYYGHYGVFTFIYDECKKPISGYCLDRCLVNACEKGYINIINFILSRHKNLKTETSVLYACQYGHFQVLKALKEYGADIHADNELPLKYALQYCHPQIVQYIIDSGALLEEIPDDVLRMVFVKGNLTIIKMLLDCHNLILNAKIFHLSKFQNHKHITEFFLKHEKKT